MHRALPIGRYHVNDNRQPCQVDRIHLVSGHLQLPTVLRPSRALRSGRRQMLAGRDEARRCAGDGVADDRLLVRELVCVAVSRRSGQH